MNTRLLLAILSVAALSSCSTSYKAQTPDDVYYSPAKPQAEYVKTETKKEPEVYRYESSNDYYSPEDRYLRWKVRNPQRWSTFDNYAYQWSAYDMYPSCTSSYAPWRSYWNSYWTWNGSYNPYCRSVIVVNPKTNATVYNRIRTYTPGTYNNTTYNNSNNHRPVKVSAGAYSPNGTYNNSNSSSSNGNNNSLGNSLKKIFSNSNSYNNNNSSSSSSSDRPNRTYTPSSSSSSSSSGSSGRSSSSGSSGGSSGGGGGVSRPSRGG